MQRGAAIALVQLALSAKRGGGLASALPLPPGVRVLPGLRTTEGVSCEDGARGMPQRSTWRWHAHRRGDPRGDASMYDQVSLQHTRPSAPLLWRLTRNKALLRATLAVRALRVGRLVRCSSVSVEALHCRETTTVALREGNVVLPDEWRTEEPRQATTSVATPKVHHSRGTDKSRLSANATSAPLKRHLQCAKWRLQGAH